MSSIKHHKYGISIKTDFFLNIRQSSVGFGLVLIYHKNRDARGNYIFGNKTNGSVKLKVKQSGPIQTDSFLHMFYPENNTLTSGWQKITLLASTAFFLSLITSLWNFILPMSLVKRALFLQNRLQGKYKHPE